MVVSDHYLKNNSQNPIQTWCIHLLDEGSELIDYLAKLGKFWPSSGHKIAENGCFRPLFEKAFKQSNRMAWQWAETLVEIRVTPADIRGTTK